MGPHPLAHLPFLPTCPVCDHCVVLLLDDLERLGSLLPAIREQLRGINTSSVAWAQLHRLNASIADLQVLSGGPLDPPSWAAGPHGSLPTEPAPEPCRPPPRDCTAAGGTGGAE